MPTPQEMAASSNGPQKQSWLLDSARSPRDILCFIRDSPKDSHDTHLAIHALSVRISEEQAKSAEVLERYTRQLVSLTRAIVWLTVVLLIVTVGFAVFHRR